MIVCHYDLEVLFSNYKNLLQERLDRYRLLHICEDSVRYDFFLRPDRNLWVKTITNTD